MLHAVSELTCVVHVLPNITRLSSHNICPSKLPVDQQTEGQEIYDFS